MTNENIVFFPQYSEVKHSGMISNIKENYFYFEMDILDDGIEEFVQMCIENEIDFICAKNGPGGGNPCVMISHKNKTVLQYFITKINEDFCDEEEIIFLLEQIKFKG